MNSVILNCNRSLKQLCTNQGQQRNSVLLFHAITDSGHECLKYAFNFQIKDKVYGSILGHFSVQTHIPLIFSDTFYIRLKTNGQGESKGFSLHWSGK